MMTLTQAALAELRIDQLLGLDEALPVDNTAARDLVRAELIHHTIVARLYEADGGDDVDHSELFAWASRNGV